MDLAYSGHSLYSEWYYIWPFMPYLSHWAYIFKVHPSCSMCQDFTSFYGWIIFHCMDIPPSVYHSSVDRQLGCFHLWAIMNNTAVNIHVEVLFECLSLFLLGIHLGIELLGVIILYLTFWGLVKLFSASAMPFFYSHQQCMRVPVFSHPHQNILRFLLTVALLEGVEWFVFFWWLIMWSIFSYAS